MECWRENHRTAFVYECPAIGSDPLVLDLKFYPNNPMTSHQTTTMDGDDDDNDGMADVSDVISVRSHCPIQMEMG